MFRCIHLPSNEQNSPEFSHTAAAKIMCIRPRLYTTTERLNGLDRPSTKWRSRPKCTKNTNPTFSPRRQLVPKRISDSFHGYNPSNSPYKPVRRRNPGDRIHPIFSPADPGANYVIANKEKKVVHLPGQKHEILTNNEYRYDRCT